MLQLTNVSKSFRVGKKTKKIIDSVSLDFARSEFVGIHGKSGSGKSSLLRLIGLIDTPDIGKIHYKDEDITNLPSGKRSAARLDIFGFVFQSYDLISELSVLQNIIIPAEISQKSLLEGESQSNLQDLGLKYLDMVGLADKARDYPKHLSGGEMQRVAIARSLITKPEIILADEPTSNLDSKNSEHIIQLLKDLQQQLEKLVILVSHDEDEIAQTDRAILLRDGKVVQR